jgi:hypothetical protein
LIRLLPAGAGLLTLLASFLPYGIVKIDVFGFGSSLSYSAWSGPASGWLGVLLTLFCGVAVSAQVAGDRIAALNQKLVAQLNLIGLVGLGLAWLLIFVSMFGIIGDNTITSLMSVSLGFGYWATWFFATVALVVTFLIWRSSKTAPSAGRPAEAVPAGPTAPAPTGPTAPAPNQTAFGRPGQAGPAAAPPSQPQPWAQAPQPSQSWAQPPEPAQPWSQPPQSPSAPAQPWSQQPPQA